MVNFAWNTSLWSSERWGTDLSKILIKIQIYLFIENGVFQNVHKMVVVSLEHNMIM